MGLVFSSVVRWSFRVEEGGRIRGVVRGVVGDRLEGVG